MKKELSLTRTATSAERSHTFTLEATLEDLLSPLGSFVHSFVRWFGEFLLEPNNHKNQQRHARARGYIIGYRN